MSRRMWEAVETKTRDGRMAKTERGREEGRSRQEVKRKGAKKRKEKTKKKEKNGSKEISRRMGNLG